MTERLFIQEGVYVTCTKPCAGPFDENLDCCLGPVEGMTSDHISNQFPKCTALGSPKIGLPLTSVLSLSSIEENYYLCEKHGCICALHTKEIVEEIK
jgi:hypothetical protein